MRLAALALAAALALPVVAHAQATPAADAPVAQDRTGEQIEAWLNEEPVRGVAATAQQDVAPVRDRAIHGEVGFALGSNGYRSAYGIANMPLGDSSDLTVAVAGAHSDGFKTRDGYRLGGGDSKSLAISLRLGTGVDSRRCVGERYRNVPRWGVYLRNDRFDECERGDPPYGGFPTPLAFNGNAAF